MAFENIIPVDIGGAVNNFFLKGGLNFFSSITYVVFWGLILGMIVAVFGGLIYMVMRYNKKVIILDLWKDKVRIDRYALIMQDDVEILNFFWTKYKANAPGSPYTVWRHFGPAKEDMAYTLLQNGDIEKEVKKLIRPWYLAIFMGNKQIPEWIKQQTQEQIEQNILVPVRINTRNVAAKTFRSSLKKFQQESWLARNATVIMAGTIIVIVLFFSFVTTQQLVDAMSQQNALAQTVAQAAESIARATPPAP